MEITSVSSPETKGLGETGPYIVEAPACQNKNTCKLLYLASSLTKLIAFPAIRRERGEKLDAVVLLGCHTDM